MCLEEQYDIDLKRGAFFYHEVRSRVEVEITDDLRDIVICCAQQMHNMFSSGSLPEIAIGKHCDKCSLKNLYSVFECDVTETQYVRLKAALSDAMDNQLDSIRFYHLNKNDNRRIVTLGKKTSYNINDTIIL